MPLDDQITSTDGASKAVEMERLLEQAAACRRLSSQSRTRAGTKALVALGDHFDEQARRLNPSSLRR